MDFVTEIETANKNERCNMKIKALLSVVRTNCYAVGRLIRR